jgi:hypothetical protein
LVFITAPLLRGQAGDAEGFQQKIGQGCDKSLRAHHHGARQILTFQIENKLRWIGIPIAPHCPSPSSLKDWMVRLLSDSHRTTAGRRLVH